MSLASKTPIAFTPGEPGGIGPELLIKLSTHRFDTPIVAITNYQLIKNRAEHLGVDFHAPLYDKDKTEHPTLSILDIPLATPSNVGELNPQHAQFVLQTIKRATEGCLNREFCALTTGPISKANINSAGIAFTGHTEFLATLTGTEKTVMMLMNDSFRVALLTTHVPLAKVPTLITKENLTTTLNIISQDLRTKFSIKQPRIMVCGLNPHAGENGHLGHEEQDIILPTIIELQKKGMQVSGPIPADTAFIDKHIKNTDAILTMYHDQGLPVIKRESFTSTINVTLGLPIIRTSVDHGTALDIAGTGKADETNLIAAINLASKLANTNYEKTFTA